MYRTSERSVLHVLFMVITALILMGCDALSGPLRLNRCYRFESVNYEGQYMRHSGYRMYKHAGRGLLHWKDSTFKLVRAKNGNGNQVSLESFNYPGFFIRHSGYFAYISNCRYYDSLCKNDASWTVKNGLITNNNRERSVSFRSANYPGYFLRHQNGRVRISGFWRTDLFLKDASWTYHEVRCALP